MEKLSVVFVGSGGFGAPILEKLVQSGKFTITSVVTGQDKAQGRGMKTVFSPVKECALLNKLIIHQPQKISEVKQKLIQEKPDFILVVSYGEIIPQDIINIAKIAPVNVHPSLLPKYRGATPIHQPILNGDLVTGVTWIYMIKEMDKGDMIYQEKVAIDEDEDFPTLFKELSEFAAEKSPDVLLNYAAKPTRIPQEEAKATYSKKITKEDGVLDFNKESAEEIIRKIKAFNPWPGCTFFWNDKKLKMLKAEVIEQKISPGDFVIDKSKSMMVGTRKNAISPLIIQPESKRPMTVQEFLQGQK